MNDWIVPDWPAPDSVAALSTTRQGGVSTGPWASLNLGSNSGDDPAAVARNRELLQRHLPAAPRWLHQVHGTEVLRHEGDADLPDSPDKAGSEPAVTSPDDSQPGVLAPRADAQWTDQPGAVCAVLAADCLPVLFCNRAGTHVAAAHAGWRGLAAGVLENTVAAMRTPAGELLAWLGPAIGPAVYQVGEDVRQAFRAQLAAGAEAFAADGERWLFDLYAMARFRLQQAGVGHISGGGYCTYSEAERFYSYRRDKVTGRMASLVWLRR